MSGRPARDGGEPLEAVADPAARDAGADGGGGGEEAESKRREERRGDLEERDCFISGFSASARVILSAFLRDENVGMAPT